jgi:serine kinase of HPr protein (carbohydrate metabolism regulator)
VRPAQTLAGLIEVRGLGIRRVPHEPVGVAGWVLDLVPEADRLPGPEGKKVSISGVVLPRFVMPSGTDPLPGIVAALARGVCDD